MDIMDQEDFVHLYVQEDFLLKIKGRKLMKKFQIVKNRRKKIKLRNVNHVDL